MTIYPAHFFAAEYPPHDPARRATIDGMEDDDTWTNGQRAADALTQDPDNDNPDLSDIITNLLHRAHSQGEDPAEVIRTALNNFHAEAGPMEEPATDSDPENQPFHDDYWAIAKAIAGPLPTALNGWQPVDTEDETP